MTITTYEELDQQPHYCATCDEVLLTGARMHRTSVHNGNPLINIYPVEDYREGRFIVEPSEPSEPHRHYWVPAERDSEVITDECHICNAFRIDTSRSTRPW